MPIRFGVSTLKNPQGIVFSIENIKESLLVGGTDIDDCNWYETKEVLKTSFKGRNVVQWVENNLKTSSNTKILRKRLLH
jgi:hypothetical protein